MLKKKEEKKRVQNWYNIIAIVDVCRPNHSFKGVINDCNFFAKINLVQNDWELAHIMLLLSDEFFIVLSNWKTKQKKSSLVDDVQGVIIFGQSSQLSGGVQWVEIFSIGAFLLCTWIFFVFILFEKWKYFIQLNKKEKKMSKMKRHPLESWPYQIMTFYTELPNGILLPNSERSEQLLVTESFF